jgi:hypothetical protein
MGGDLACCGLSSVTQLSPSGRRFLAILPAVALALAACKWSDALLVVRDGGTDRNGETDQSTSCSNQPGIDAGGGLSEGLVAWYRCESAAGTSGTLLLDSSSHGNDGTLVTGAGGSPGYSFAAGKVGNALSLIEASKGYVALPAGLLANACEATIATWVYINSDSNSWARIWDFGNGTNAYMFLTRITNLDQLARFGITVAGSAHEELMKGQTAVPFRKWTHVAVVLGSSGGTLYFDGAVAGTNLSMTLRPADLGNTANNYIGHSQFSVDPYLNGSVDEFRIYNRALSPDEIQALANGT